MSLMTWRLFKNSEVKTRYKIKPTYQSSFIPVLTSPALNNNRREEIADTSRCNEFSALGGCSFCQLKRSQQTCKTTGTEPESLCIMRNRSLTCTHLHLYGANIDASFCLGVSAAITTRKMTLIPFGLIINRIFSLISHISLK